MMSSIRDYWEFVDDFTGGGTFASSAGAFDPWVVSDTSDMGTPTYTRLDLGETTGAFRPGVAALAFDAQNEIQNVCLSFGDKLCFDFDTLRGFECGLRLVEGAGSHKDTTTTVAWGVTGDRNAAIDSIAVASIFRLASASAVETVVVESDDTVVNNDDVDAAFTLTISTWANFYIDFSKKTDVKYYAGLSTGNFARVAASTTFDMSNYHAGVQPFFQIQKTADTNVDSLQIDYVRLWGVRS